MKNNLIEVLKFIILVITTIIFYEVILIAPWKSEKEAFIYNSSDIFVKKYLEIKKEGNDCNFIKSYTQNNILFSEVKHDNINEIKKLYNQCPLKFQDDLEFLNKIDKKEKNITLNENDFIFFSVKYYYYLNKNDILNELNRKHYESKGSLLLKAKVIEDKIIN